jgi:vacuolar-type H+-ATPase subunit H
MSGKNPGAKDGLRQEIKPLTEGLTESDILLFISSLIDNNSELAGKIEHIDSLIRLAQERVMEAARQAETAQSESRRIIAEAKKTAEKIIRDKVLRAEQQARDIIKAAEAKAEAIKISAQEESNRIAYEAKHNIEEAKRYAQEIINTAEAKAREVEFPAELEDSTIFSEMNAEAITENQVEPLLSEEAADGQESAALYKGAIILEITPPVAMGSIRGLVGHLRYLRDINQLRVLSTEHTSSHGIRIRLLLRTPIPMLKILKSLPEVDKVSVDIRNAPGVYPAQDTVNKHHATHIGLKLKA